MKRTLPRLRIVGFPGRYTQGPGALQALPGIAQELGARHVMVVSDDTVDLAIGAKTAQDLEAGGLRSSRLRFGGECTAGAIGDLAEQARAAGGDLVVGLGGGKTIDTAKGVAKAMGSRLVIAPTIASNDSATSRLIVLYDESHRVVQIDYLARNPDVVLVDTSEIARAPVRYFKAGIGDALSKRFEAAQCRRAGGANFFGGLPPDTATLLANRCYEVIREHGEAAVQDVSRAACTSAVEAVTEATVLLSGIGFESGGLSIAHAMIRGLTGVPALCGALHGEMVAFGTLVQLVLERRAPGEIREHLDLLASVGLSANLATLGRAELAEDELRTVASLTIKAPYIANFDQTLTEAAIRDAILEADRLGS